MVKLPSRKNNNPWNNVFNLSAGLNNEIYNHIYSLSLEPGQKLNQFNEDLPGIIFVEEGQVRLLSLDEQGEPFTVEKYSKHQIVGAEQILRGVNDQIIAASSKVRLSILPTTIFFNLIKKQKHYLELFSLISLNELFSVLSSTNNSSFEKSKSILKRAKELLKSDLNLKAHNFYNEFQFSENDHKNWLVSSCNIDGFPPGSLIKSGTKLKINGKLPARLIALPSNWQTLEINNEELNTVRTKSLNSINEERETLLEEKESLEDWYGRLETKISYPHSIGKGTLEESLACLRMISQFFDIPFRKDILKNIIKNQLHNSKDNQLGILELAAIIDLIGLRSSILRPDSKQLIKRIPVPSLIIKDNHPVVLWERKAKKILLGDPINGQNWKNTEEILDVNKNDQISILFIEKTLTSPKARFGLKWFLPAIKKHKNSLIQVVIASFFVQLLGLFNPLLIQQIIDAAINQGNIQSLNVLGTLLIAMAFAQALMGSLRTYLFADTTNRIDISLGSKIIHHLLRLPLSYFSKRPVGEVSSRINELEKIRNFLTGTALTVILDAIFSVIYIVVMLTYSVKLTFFSLGVVPFFILLSLIVSPIIRKQLRKKAESSARVNSHLVESLTGMETLKGQGMELQSEWRWEKFYGSQIQAGFRNTITSTSAGAASTFLQQLSGLVVIWAGALIVLEGKMSIGQLIAFRILSGYVTGPLLRIASLWQNFQETIISLERLSDIVDQKEEIEITGENLPPLTPIKGSLSYKDVNFRFGSHGALQLSNINFDMPAGSFVGIVGSSGSGKSTLMKLLTRFYDPIEGVIYIDGQDISKIDLYSLRSQIGIVPQDCLLFDGSIQENIALSRPNASFEEIKEAAKIACAHDFIQQMSAGYSSSVGERGANLSGGQRQRIAIARVVLKSPKLLILDEATSALDIDTEQKVIGNLAQFFKEKTVLFITHRLSSLTMANKIIVLHQGAIVEQGSHYELMNANGRYATIYRQQKANI
ncbi:ATP-binding cassette domain-containing protein [Prochlorococcus marinus XMU1406]|uniref:ABC transporter transmembrane domain-containing protein n=1 Tax=Prochlorococcus marinus TaxID=1219 RepID=UPI001AD98433|nr:ABC transporter transmembrane domain-containing protein [Prochlorococcus marinus]MBO8206671.1 ATP-binding cassette domain-containing protein [Prochlorococcus marinus XMU1406]MCR8544275.1 ABC transporter transmembrane domain-containing protein [Prochlorococcus marinus XMU1427]